MSIMIFILKNNEISLGLREKLFLQKMYVFLEGKFLVEMGIFKMIY